jgi:hypothetical protein
MSFETRKEEIKNFLNEEQSIIVIGLIYKHFGLKPSEKDIKRTIIAAAMVLSLAENGRKKRVKLSPYNGIVRYTIELCVLPNEAGIDIHSATHEIRNKLFNRELAEEQAINEKFEELMRPIDLPL